MRKVITSKSYLERIKPKGDKDVKPSPDEEYKSLIIKTDEDEPNGNF